MSGVFNEMHTGEGTPVVSFNTSTSKQVILLFFFTSMFPQFSPSWLLA